jgi:glutamate racemase
VSRGAAAALLACLLLGNAGRAAAQAVDRVFEKDDITIVVTDSGLGGLSVTADLEKSLRESGAFKRVTLIFASALADVRRTYNAMATTREKIEAFDRALEGMARWYSPDLILVACNTLSVLLPEVPFVAAGRVPVVGIVASGISVLGERVKADPAATAIVMGTPTTIESSAYRKGVLALGVQPERVFEQACPNLETEIQADPSSDVVRNLIEAYADQARTSIGARAKGPVVVGLCCSHYGYSRALFQDVLDDVFGRRVEIVDPNLEMSRSLMSHARRGAFGSTDTVVRVVSRAEITAGERDAIASVLVRVSPKTAAALRSYERKMDLFDTRK